MSHLFPTDVGSTGEPSDVGDGEWETPPSARVTSSGVLGRAALLSLPLLSLTPAAPQPSSVCEGRLCEGRACGRPRGCGGDGGMDVSGGEAAAAGPVWQTLKGLSSRDVQCSSPTTTSPPGQQGPRPMAQLLGSDLAAERLARRASCPLEAPTSLYSPKDPGPPQLVIPDTDRSQGLLNGSPAVPLSASPGEGPNRSPWGPPSSSTTSTSLSNTNLALHNNNNHFLSNNNINYATSPKEEEEDQELGTPSVFR